eukprot:5136892-Pyramimonas_sp.AAC.1
MTCSRRSSSAAWPPSPSRLCERPTLLRRPVLRCRRRRARHQQARLRGRAVGPQVLRASRPYRLPGAACD